jgi:hypothetical protein
MTVLLILDIGMDTTIYFGSPSRVTSAKLVLDIRLALIILHLKIASLETGIKKSVPVAILSVAIKGAELSYLSDSTKRSNHTTTTSANEDET